MVTQSEIDAKVIELELDGSKPTSKLSCGAFIDGKLCNAISGKTIDSLNPATGKVVAKIACCNADDVDLAVKAARGACTGWASVAPRDRKTILVKFANLIEEHALEFAVIDAVEVGKPINDNLTIDVPDAAACIRFHAEAIDKLMDTIAPTGPDTQALIVREPLGVVGLVVPWNFPLLMASWKVGPALATGNAIVLKPSEMTSLSAIKMAELAIEAGVPPGVFNVVPGLGIEAGAALSNHMDVDMIGFTGSTVVGRSVLKASAESNLKRVSLELGGKSPQIVFADAEDLDDVADHIMIAAFLNQAENCSCGSRLFVQNEIKDELIKKVMEKIPSRIMGDPLKLETCLGSMISELHYNRVMSFIETGKKEGAKLLHGGGRILENLGGHFVDVTVFEGNNSMTIAQEEIFGPCLCIIPFSDEEEVIKLANDTKYGLAGSVYTSNINKAHRVSRSLKGGNISINCFSEGDVGTPFGGYKQSGFIGRDKSIYAHEQYTELKTIWTQFK